MERCPHCGQLSRMGAKFCTICGARLLAEEPTVGAETLERSASELEDAEPEGQPGETTESEGWPVSSAPTETASSEWTPPEPNETAANGESSAADEPELEAPSSPWAASPSGAWPAAPDHASEPAEVRSELEAESLTDADVAFDAWPRSEPDPGPESEHEADRGLATEPEQVPVAEAATESVHEHEPQPPDNVVAAEARARAVGLLDELRAAIAAISGNAPLDLSGVISDLDVAVTPPGAIEPEKLAELREALLAAREHPRDIDTVVDLTGRLDAMVALVIAYDRTIAAIERSLATLRETDPGEAAPD